jgi:hypothetical protein
MSKTPVILKERNMLGDLVVEEMVVSKFIFRNRTSEYGFKWTKTQQEDEPVRSIIRGEFLFQLTVGHIL